MIDERAGKLLTRHARGDHVALDSLGIASAEETREDDGGTSKSGPATPRAHGYGSLAPHRTANLSERYRETISRCHFFDYEQGGYKLVTFTPLIQIAFGVGELAEGTR